MKPEEFLIILVGAAIIVKVTILDEILAFYNKVVLTSHSLYQSFLSFLFSWKALIILLIILFPFFIYLNYRLNINFSDKLKERRDRREKIEEEKQNIKKLLEINPENLNLEELSKYFDNLCDKFNLTKEFKKLEEFKSDLLDRKSYCEELLEKLKKEKELQEHRDEKERLENKNKEIREENEKLLEERKDKKYAILGELEAKRNNVFLRDELSEEEIEALIWDGFEQANEYCVFEKRIIPVLVKKIMNHSKTHTFLVWSIKQLLEEMEVDDIEEHETRYPDITFSNNGEEFAIEVELGSLLRKKKQARDKVKFLNNNFGENWIFVVSNKELLPKYRKLGFATQRSGVEESVKKLLNPDI